ncbi:hypothetical protein HYFRA_00004609 [Hymenoscyphus fraxineus]|uniref:Uncharacterized protein n=1 Tax=Hymenoscyphus fraxineus TaxID=746836 RepID=A0A9N9L093_9HELO|nr:hypothetical protein HYFRA_00004609 [Hymenoscyphus fraxineus]
MVRDGVPRQRVGYRDEKMVYHNALVIAIKRYMPSITVLVQVFDSGTIAGSRSVLAIKRLAQTFESYGVLPWEILVAGVRKTCNCVPPSTTRISVLRLSVGSLEILMSSGDVTGSPILLQSVRVQGAMSNVQETIVRPVGDLSSELPVGIPDSVRDESTTQIKDRRRLKSTTVAGPVVTTNSDGICPPSLVNGEPEFLLSQAQMQHKHGNLNVSDRTPLLGWGEVVSRRRAAPAASLNHKLGFDTRSSRCGHERRSPSTSKDKVPPPGGTINSSSPCPISSHVANLRSHRTECQHHVLASTPGTTNDMLKERGCTAVAYSYPAESAYKPPTPPPTLKLRYPTTVFRSCLCTTCSVQHFIFGSVVD